MLDVFQFAVFILLLLNYAVIFLMHRFHFKFRLKFFNVGLDSEKQLLGLGPAIFHKTLSKSYLRGFGFLVTICARTT